jgi:hypothetical protein
MQLKRTILGGVLVVATMAFLLGAAMDLGGLISYGGTLTGNVIANVVVSSTCYISLSNTLITFTLSPTQNTMTLTNVITDSDVGGNAQATILISGGTGNTLNAQTGTGNWIGTTSGDANTIYITNTVYGTSTSTAYGSGTAITSVLTSTGSTVAAPTTGSPTQSTTLFLGMAVPAAQNADTYTTNIVLENSC